MYLKKLKMKGFKSFADTVEMDFSQGVSAIVGPNGSGKSNITDAIRWVLGEQSTKSLRGKKMEDVIFAGTEKKAPLGYAEVVLTLDNSDAAIPDAPDEVSVTRRLFRSGESEYRLNQKQCKLKDIHELFTDTGLGKNGYSLISQGGIEKIVGSTPQELRDIVEEAVGIVNYKTRKQEAEKKLDRTQDNMDRVQDIMDELAKQRKPLARQAEKAKEYLEIHGALKQVDLLLFCEKMAQNREDLDKYATQMVQLEAEIETITKGISQKDLAFVEGKEAIRILSDDLVKIDEGMAAINEQITQAGGEILVSEERLRNREESTHRLKASAETLSREKTRILGERETTLEDRDALVKTMARLKEDITRLENKRNGHQKQVDIMAMRMEEQVIRAEAMSQKRETLKGELSTLNQEISALDARMTMNTEQVEAFIGERADLSQVQKEREDAVEKLDQLILAADIQVKEKKNQGDELKEALKTLHDKIALLKNNMTVNRSKGDYLKKVQQNYSDYFPGIQLIMNSEEIAPKVRKQIYGPVGELITVPEPYARAMDVALGGKSQNIVVETVAVANHCIGVLKQKRAGRATFLPKDNLRYRSLSSQETALINGCEGIKGIASRLVTCDPHLEGVVESLLGRILVADHFGAAQAARKRFPQLTIVTLEGEVFYPGGAIVGGTTKGGKQSPLFKKVEIQRLDLEHQRMEAEKTRLAAHYDHRHSHYEAMKVAYTQGVDEKNTLERKRWQLTQEIQGTKNHLGEINKRLLTLNESRETTEKALEGFRKRISQKQVMLLAVNERAETPAFDGDLEELKGEIGRLNREISEGRIDVAKNNERLRAITHQLDRLDQQFQDLLKQDEALKAEMSGAAKEMTALKERLDHRRQDVVRLEALKGRKQEQKKDQSQRIQAMTADNEALDRAIRALNHDLILQNEAKGNVEIAQNKVISDQAHLEETIYARYEVNHIMAQDAVAAMDTRDVDVSPQRQRTLRGQLAALGQVNVNAIEEYAQVNERYTFLREQFDDLVEAKKELSRIIDNLYTSMERQFSSRFSELQTIFTRVFSVLFEGGRARISYTDPEKVMESGIELIAQPPGKNLRHISLLSGGEKSMTAIALLFSFLELSPSPFCVIDEIDAALDDQNIYRFTSYMAHIVNHNQFVIITHRKSTLEVCDAIYGVSMSVSGMSKLVSIRLSDYVEPAS